MTDQENNTQVKSENASNLAGKKILWVEDDTTLNDILEQWLKRYTAELRHTTHGRKALKMIQEVHPDVILLDILLPDMSGFDILESIKADQQLSDIPVIMISNLSSDKDIEQANRLGADRFIVKSTVFLDKIVQEIDSVIREHLREQD